MAVITPVTLPEKRRFRTQLEVLFKGGYSRLVRDGEFIDIEHLLADDNLPETASGYDLLVDRLSVAYEGDDELSRLADSVETAFLKDTTR